MLQVRYRTFVCVCMWHLLSVAIIWSAMALCSVSLSPPIRSPLFKSTWLLESTPVFRSLPLSLLRSLSLFPSLSLSFPLVSKAVSGLLPRTAELAVQFHIAWPGFFFCDGNPQFQLLNCFQKAASWRLVHWRNARRLGGEEIEKTAICPRGVLQCFKVKISPQTHFLSDSGNG